MKKIKGICAIIAISAIILISFKTDRVTTNFSGTWVINTSKSVFGNHPQNWAYKKISVTQSQESIKVDNQLSKSDGSDSTSSETLLLNGAVSTTVLPNTAHGVDTRHRSASISSDGLTLTVTEHHEIDKGTDIAVITVTDVWGLSADGKELTIIRTFEFADGTTTVKAVYDRQ